MNTGGMKFRTAVCPHCGATVTIGENISHITCSYCGSDILIDDTASETDRVLQAHSNARKRDYQTQIEYEKQKSDLEYEKEKKMQDLRLLAEERSKKEEERIAFKKGKSSKFLIVFAVICLLSAISCFQNGKIASGLIACLQTALFGGSWAVGMQYIKAKTAALHTLLTVAGLLLIIPFLLCTSFVYTSRPDLKWPESGLSASIPDPKAQKGEVTLDSDSVFSADIYRFPEERYDDYVSACIDLGFSVNAIKDPTSYNASAADGTQLILIYYESQKEMSISLYAPQASSDSNTSESSAAAETLPEEKPDQNSDAASAAVTPEFKEAMDSYEAFFDEYIDFMSKMSTTDSSAEMLSEYSEYMTKYADTMQKMDSIDEDKLSPADDAYYLEVMARITEKLTKASLENAGNAGS